MKKVKTYFKQNQSAIYIAIILTIIIFYLCVYLFVNFTNPTRSYSEEIKNEAISLENIEIKMTGQKYNPENGLYVMTYKVMPQNEKAVVVNKENLEVAGFMERGEGTSLETKTYFTMNDYFIVEMHDVPKDYKALKINFKYHTQDTSNNEVEMEGAKYTSASEKDIDRKLTPKTKDEYMYDSYLYLQESLEKKVKKNEEAQKNILSRIDRVEKETSMLDEKDPTLSESEREIVKETISNNKADINGLKKDYASKVKAKETLLKNIERVKQVLNDFQ